LLDLRTAVVARCKEDAFPEMTEQRESWTDGEAIDILIEIARTSGNDAAIKRLNEIDAVTRTADDDIYPPDEVSRRRAVTRGRR
jgi:hypothetical protein